MDESYVRIFDTTLRDGEQSPGCSMTPPEKLEVARALAALGVDVIEAGFPAASPGDLAAVRQIALEVGRHGGPVVCGLARATKEDLDKAWHAVRGAERSRIHTFLATSELHMQHKLRMSRPAVLERIRMACAYARSLCPDVEFSPEDGSRTDPDFLDQVVDVAVEAGATTINIPDTVGYTTPDEYGPMIARLVARVRGRAVISVHCHDDLGLATANTLAALKAGARQAEVTVNGIGERAGNCALEEVVMALHTRSERFGLRTGVDTAQLVRASRLVASCTGMAVQANKAIVGANAFAHESGIHQDGMLKHEETYEIMRPDSVGAGQTKLVLGKHSGSNAFQSRLRQLGHEFSPAELGRAFQRFKEIADRKKTITDADLEALVSSELDEGHQVWELDALQVGCGTSGMATASVKLRGPDGLERVAAAVGTGPIDAVYKAIDEIVRAKASLLEYAVHAVTEGIDALAQVNVRVRAEDAPHPMHPQHEPRAPIFHGHGADTDIVVASAKAYLYAINRLVSVELRGVPSVKDVRQDAVRPSVG